MLADALLQLNGVIHSFWVPALNGKKDVVPGRTQFLKLEADKPGVYLGQCAEYCGLSHADMRMRVIAQTAADYQAWVQQQLAQTVAGATLEEGRRQRDLAVRRAATASSRASRARSRRTSRTSPTAPRSRATSTS